VSQPFAQWGDVNGYTLAPGADFEGSLANWTLQGAQQGSGSESFGVTGSVGRYSLSLPTGAVATSPSMCVDAAYPDFRFFARSSTPGATVQVSVVYPGPVGPIKVPVGRVVAGSGWAPTQPMATGSAIAAVLGGGTAQLSLQFKASGGATQIDDIYIDPWGSCC
jgi:hypothetical protein